MLNSKKGSTLIVNLASVIITVIIILAVGVVYYMFLSPDELEIEQIEYTKIDRDDYEIDKEFEEGLDTTIDISYTDDDLDMHRDLKDYYQGREDAFTKSDDRNDGVNIYSEIERPENSADRITNSRPDLAPIPSDEEEIDIDTDTENTNTQQNNNTILNF